MTLIWYIIGRHFDSLATYVNSASCVDLASFVDLGHSFDCTGFVFEIQLGAEMCSKVVLNYA